MFISVSGIRPYIIDITSIRDVCLSEIRSEIRIHFKNGETADLCITFANERDARKEYLSIANRLISLNEG